jgi:hypothetical protein
VASLALPHATTQAALVALAGAVKVPDAGTRSLVASLALPHATWNMECSHTRTDTHSGRPAAAPTSYHSPMDALADSYRLALVRTHAVGRGHGPFPFPRAMHEQVK